MMDTIRAKRDEVYAIARKHKAENGKVKFTAGPKDADAKTFFMKVKMK